MTENLAFLLEEESDLDVLTLPDEERQPSETPSSSGRKKEDKLRGVKGAVWSTSSSPYTHKQARRHGNKRGSTGVGKIVVEVPNIRSRRSKLDYRKWMPDKGKHSLHSTRENTETSSSSDASDTMPMQRLVSLVVCGPVPYGHYLKSIEDLEDQIEYEEFDGFNEEKINIFDESTFLGKALASTSVKPEQRLGDALNKEASLAGAKLLSNVSRVPLNEAWQRFSEAFLFVVFFANVVLMAYDLYNAPIYLYYKVTALGLGIIENIVAWLMALVSKHPKFKNAVNKDQLDKAQQYTENILHEILLIPLIILSVIGFANDKLYREPSSVVGWMTIILFCIDALDITWNQILRAKMIYKLFEDVQGLLDPDCSAKLCTQKHGAILPRLFVVIIGNSLVFMVMLGMLGFQVHSDNYEKSSYYISMPSAILIVNLIVLPIFSVSLFILANSYWIMEMFIALTFAVGQQKQVEVENINETLAEAINYAVANTDATQKRLDNLMSVHPVKKFFYALTEPMIVLFLIWLGLVFITPATFSGAANVWVNFSIRLSFVLIAVASNVQLFLVAVSAIVATVVSIVFVILYPLSIITCCRKKEREDFDDIV